MKIYNRKTLPASHTIGESECLISIGTERITISKKLAALLQLQAKDRIVFGEDEDGWFIGKTLSADGMQLHSTSRNGMYVHCTALCRIMRKRLKVIHKKSVRVFVDERSKVTHGKDTLYQIIMAAMEIKQKTRNAA